MENNLLPDKKKDGILSRLKNFFKSIFYKQSKEVDYIDNTVLETKSSEENFMKDLKEKTDMDNAYEKETIEYLVVETEKNPEKLNNLDVEQLEKISEYYDQKIENVDKEIEKVKKTNK